MMKRLAVIVLPVALVVLLTSCWFDRYDFTAGTTEKSRDRFAQISSALNAHDEAALMALFTDDARATNSAELEQGVASLLERFPDGIVVLETKRIPSVEYARHPDGRRVVFMRAMYKISAGGEDYSLFFGEFLVNEVDPDNVGVYALGVGPRIESLDTDEEYAFFRWTDPFDVDPISPSSIYIPFEGVKRI